MTAYDVFNGDADGMCALQQLRLAHPTNSRLITGVKRDIGLLRHVFPDRGDAVTVLDLSLDTNRADLVRILDSGAEVAYFDHHFAGSVPAHALLRPHLSPSKDVCTSTLVDEFLHGRHRLWAVVGAFGDNLDAIASELASPIVGAAEIDRLLEMGRLLNYNSYGTTVADLHFSPEQLYRRLRPYSDPLDFVAGEDVFARLREGYASDMANAAEQKPDVLAPLVSIYVLPDAPWSRRISGLMANDVIRRRPDMSHAVIVPNTAVCYMVSVRVSQDNPRRADDFCRQFDTGGGRATAGGINHLPRQRLEDFVQLFQESFS